MRGCRASPYVVLGGESETCEESVVRWSVQSCVLFERVWRVEEGKVDADHGAGQFGGLWNDVW